MFSKTKKFSNRITFIQLHLESQLSYCRKRLPHHFGEPRRQVQLRATLRHSRNQGCIFQHYVTGETSCQAAGISLTSSRVASAGVKFRRSFLRLGFTASFVCNFVVAMGESTTPPPKRRHPS